ncbi:hypothetical protein T265_11263 [Opisthorchis viverrini]|uniref:RNase III domain-containing protein n=1 Tax=Opisthorchis viverrini TaxID=6198 RepID=A0A074ZA51_OPIVI|nr:hypothetical protein T265_11263 [Opisthorchis viverrini]KER20115.1 hypothetical protein T265_11263 [Opisthorchis viverrini]
MSPYEFSTPMEVVTYQDNHSSNLTDTGDCWRALHASIPRSYDSPSLISTSTCSETDSSSIRSLSCAKDFVDNSHSSPPTTSPCSNSVPTSSQVPTCGPKKTLYPLQTVDRLTAPYQNLPCAGNPVHIYTWSLPKPPILASLAGLDPQCFTNTDRGFGLLFSQPIAANEYVCRLPLYLTRGMARARVRHVKSVILSEEMLEVIIAAHRVIAELLTNIADLSHVGQMGTKQRLDALSHANSEGRPRPCAQNVRDRFSDLHFDPVKSRTLCLVTFFCSSTNDIDLEAARTLLKWNKGRINWNFQEKAVPGRLIQPNHGIIPAYPVWLSQVPMAYWPGVLVRPCHLPSNDPGLFAVSGASSKTGLDPVPPNLAEKVCAAVNSEPSSNSENAVPIPVNPVFSYVDYFAIRHPAIFCLLDRIDHNLPLVGCHRLTRHQNAAQVTAGMRKNNSIEPADDKEFSYLADGCILHPLSAWLWFQMSIIPMIVYQMTRALSALQLFTVLSHELGYSCPPPSQSTQSPSSVDPTVLLPDRLDSPKCMLSDLQRSTAADVTAEENFEDEYLLTDEASRRVEPSKHVPNPADLLESLTLLGARDAVNLERLELLGDSVLQLISTLTVYSGSHEDADEGQLTAKRVALVSNSNLRNIAVRLGWQNYCTGQVYSPPDHFMFPCYDLSSSVPHRDSDTRLFVRLTDKSLADMVEAIVGCFLQHLGLPAAFRLLTYLGISPYANPSSQGKEVGAWDQLLSETQQNNRHSHSTLFRPLEFRPTFYLPDRNCPAGSISRLPNGTEKDDLIERQSLRLVGLQNILGYQFKDISLLIRALTHQSSPQTSLFGSYQRLEFLGDAVLGYVITIYLYEKHVEFDPGQLTESRSNIVSNNSLACAIVEHQLHPYITHNQPAFDTAVDFIQFILDTTTSLSDQLELLNQEVLKGLRAKILADVFEAIVGAIFVDTQGSLSTVSQLIHRLLDSRIDDYLLRNPMNPLKSMHILHPRLKYTEGQVEEAEAGKKYKLCATVSGGQVFTYGATRNEARLALARHLQVPLRTIDQNQC